MFRYQHRLFVTIGWEVISLCPRLYSQSASPIQHTVNLVFGYKVFLKVYFNVKIHADFKSVCSQTQNVESFAKSMI